MSRKYRPAETHQLTSYIAVVLLVMVMFVSVGFFFFLTRPDEQAVQAEAMAAYEAAAMRWQTERPARIRYALDRSCECPDEDSRAYVATELDGKRHAEFPIPVESVSGDLISAPPRPLWIDDIFGIIERAIESGAAIDVRYDQALGYPESVVIGPDEKYEIRDFELVPP